MEWVLVFIGLLALGEAREMLNSTSTRSLKGFSLVGLYQGCPQGPQQLNTHETNHNHHDWWEKNWGRSGASWPRRGFSSCWANRGTECALPDQDHVVCLPGTRKGSTANKGWALDPKSQKCQPGVHCLYGCEPGYYWTAFNDAETSNFDHVHGPKRGHCDGTWDYGTSTHGVYCKPDGTLALPQQPLCQLGETYVFAENRLNTHFFLCQTVFPGHEIFMIPTLVRPGETVMLTTQPKNYWSGPTYASPTHGDFYVSFAGADIMEACTWDEISPSGASLLPYEIGSGVEDNGHVFSTHYFYQQPNSEVPRNMIGYELDLECNSSEEGVCAKVFRHANVVKSDVLRRPQQGTTQVKFVFKPPATRTTFGEMYREPNRNHLDPKWIRSMRYYPTLPPSAHSGHHFGRKIKAVQSSVVKMDNQISKPMIVCQKGMGGFTSVGKIVLPGDSITLGLSSEYHVSIADGSDTICEGKELPWIFYTGNTDHGMETKFSHKQKKQADDSTLNFSVLLNCSSEMDICKNEEGKSIAVTGLKDPNLMITYVVTPRGAPTVITGDSSQQLTQ